MDYSSFASQQPSKVTLLLTGDVMLGRTVMIKSQSLNDPVYPFRKISEILKRFDIVFINLETPVIHDCPRLDTGLVFCASPEMVDGLVHSGVDIVNLANNHTGNFGNEGLQETSEILEKSGILSTGLGELTVLEKNGILFGFLGFDYVFKPANPKHLELVKASDFKVDVLVVGVHWGDEYKDKVNEFQRTLAKEFVKNGADVVVGHHPHWIQDIEIIDGVPVYYSLGNFIFDQMWSEETKKGLTARLTFKGGDLVQQELLPTYMESWAQPEFKDEK